MKRLITSIFTAAIFMAAGSASVHAAPPILPAPNLPTSNHYDPNPPALPPSPLRSMPDADRYRIIRARASAAAHVQVPPEPVQLSPQEMRVLMLNRARAASMYSPAQSTTGSMNTPRPLQITPPSPVAPSDVLGIADAQILMAPHDYARLVDLYHQSRLDGNVPTREIILSSIRAYEAYINRERGINLRFDPSDPLLRIIPIHPQQTPMFPFRR